MQSKITSFRIDLAGARPSPNVIRKVAAGVQVTFRRLLETGQIKLWARIGCATEHYRKLPLTCWPVDPVAATASGRMDWINGGFFLRGSNDIAFDCRIESCNWPADPLRSSPDFGKSQPFPHWLPLRYLLISHDDIVETIQREFTTATAHAGAPEFETTVIPGCIMAQPTAKNPDWYYEFRACVVEKHGCGAWPDGRKPPALETYFLWDSPELWASWEKYTTRLSAERKATPLETPEINVSPVAQRKVRKSVRLVNVVELLKEYPRIMSVTPLSAKNDITRLLRERGLIAGNETVSNSTIQRAKRLLNN